MKDKLTAEESKLLLQTLSQRFNNHIDRHPSLKWNKIEEKLKQYPEKMWSLYQMESTGGEPDVVAYDESEEVYLFYDCSAESPKERRSLCYDKAALEKRKKHKPENSAVELAQSMGIELLSEEEYKQLQQLGDFDKATSSWLKTPKEIRDLGGAIFGDFRFNHVFIYHNSAESYYSSRGFRGVLKI